MYFKHVNLIIITHACVDFSGVLLVVFADVGIGIHHRLYLYNTMLRNIVLINKSNTMYMYFKHVNPPTYMC